MVISVGCYIAVFLSFLCSIMLLLFFEFCRFFNHEQKDLYFESRADDVDSFTSSTTTIDDDLQTNNKKLMLPPHHSRQCTLRSFMTPTTILIIPLSYLYLGYSS